MAIEFDLNNRASRNFVTAMKVRSSGNESAISVISLWRRRNGGFVSTYYQKAIGNYREENEISGAVGSEKGV